MEALVHITGYAGTEVEVRGQGTVSSFRLACTPRIRVKGGEYGDGNTTWIEVSCFRGLAEHVAASIRKGDPVVVIGRLRTSIWEKNGQSTTGWASRRTRSAMTSARGPRCSGAGHGSSRSSRHQPRRTRRPTRLGHAGPRRGGRPAPGCRGAPEQADAARPGRVRAGLGTRVEGPARLRDRRRSVGRAANAGDSVDRRLADPAGTSGGRPRTSKGRSPMPEFIYSMHNVRKALGDKVVLDNITLSFYPGAKIGVVGPTAPVSRPCSS